MQVGSSDIRHAPVSVGALPPSATLFSLFPLLNGPLVLDLSAPGIGLQPSSSRVDPGLGIPYMLDLAYPGPVSLQYDGRLGLGPGLSPTTVRSFLVAQLDPVPYRLSLFGC